MKYIDTIRELLFLYVVLLLACASLYSVFEGVSFSTSLWWASVTAMTVGYGDIYPATVGGKFVSAFLMHSSVLFILPLLIGHMCGKCIKDANEFTHEEQEEIKETLKRIEKKLGSEK